MREIACPIGLALSPGGLAAIGVSPLMYAQPGLSAERKRRSLSSNRMGDVQQQPQVWRGGAGAFIARTFTPCLAKGWRTGAKRGVQRLVEREAWRSRPPRYQRLVSIGHTTVHRPRWASTRAGLYGVHGRGRPQPTKPCRQGLAGGPARQEDRLNLGNLSLDVTLCLEPANGSAEGSKGLVALAGPMSRRDEATRSAHEVHTIGEHGHAQTIGQVGIACALQRREAELQGIKGSRINIELARILKQ